MQRFVLSILLFFLINSTLQARERLTNWAIGPHMTISFPQSRLADYSRTGEGLGAKILYRWEAVRFFTPRCDITYLSFGEKRTSIPGSYSIYDVIQTRNESFQLTVGAQFSQKIGRFTFYTQPMAGYYNFRTIVTVDDYYYEYIYGTPYSETKSSRTRPGWGANAGLMFDLGLGPHLDLQFNYQSISKVIKTVANNQSVYKDATDFSISFGVVFFLKEKY
ncbi:MAG TPA: hypothetical protein PLP19_08355 [bacterium]|nr:hypothetical protein [bacterium]HPN43485.1 hypothetical protein [bacterium]